MKKYDPTKIAAEQVEELRRHDEFALLYNHHTDNANLIADMHNLLPDYRRGGRIEINGDIYITFRRKK